MMTIRKKPFERMKRQNLLWLEMDKCCPIGFFLTVKYRIENAWRFPF
jgi:hypothetical protein